MNLLRVSASLLIAAAALLFGGCATASKPTAMIATVKASVAKNPQSVSVAVTGGSDTSSMGASKIANADFAEAIKGSITQSGLFAKIGSDTASDYALAVQIVRLDQPMFGASFTVTLECTWRLSRRSDGQVVWEKAINTPFTATMGDAFSGVTRLRLANEGAARANIEEAITQLGAVKLP
jgi:ABC-type uncharacterized transport system auxiliary subunit